MDGYHRLATTEEVSPGEIGGHEADGHRVAPCGVNGDFRAIEDVCRHDGGDVGQGELRGKAIRCPRQGATFDVTTGRALTLLAVKPVPGHEVRIEDGHVRVSPNGARVAPTRAARRRRRKRSP